MYDFDIECETFSVYSMLHVDESLAVQEAKITELIHVIEFCNLNAVQIMKVHKLLKTAYERRRHYKNLKSIVQTVTSAKNLEKISAGINTRMHKYKSMCEKSKADIFK